MNEQDKRLCQCMRPSYLEGGLCGRPAVWEYRRLDGLPAFLCEGCVTRFAAPWMQKRLTRLDAGSAPEIPDNSTHETSKRGGERS